MIDEPVGYTPCLNLFGLAPIDLPRSGDMEPFPGYGRPGSVLWNLNRARDYLWPEQMEQVSEGVRMDRIRTAYDFVEQALERLR